MAFSNVSYTGNGTTTAFAVPFPYLFQTDVAVTVNGSVPTFVWTNPALITITPAPTSGATVLIKRTTEVATLEVVFEDGSTVQASDINTDGLQMLYLAQEQQDGISGVIAAGAAATAAATAATAAAAAATAAAVPMVGDSGSGGSAGLVPAPPAGSFALKKFLSAGGTWLAPGAGIPNPPLYLENFGGGVGVSNNSPALVAALASLGSNSGTIALGPGVYTFLSAVVFNYTNSQSQGISILGMGSDVTALKWPTTGGIQFNMISCHNSIHIRDLSMWTGSVNTKVAIGITNSFQGGTEHLNDISRCVFSGADLGALTQVWSTAIQSSGVTNLAVRDCVIYGSSTSQGIGIFYGGISTGTGLHWAFSLTCDTVQFQSLNVGIELGPWWQGVYVNNCNFSNSTSFGGGILQTGSDPSNALAELLVTNNQFGPLAGQCITISSPIQDMTLMGNLFIIPNNTAGVNVTPNAGTSVIGNTFVAAVTANLGQTALSLGATGGAASPSIVTGNVFYNVQIGVTLQTGSSNINVQSNVYKTCTTPTTNTGTGNTIGGGSA